MKRLLSSLIVLASCCVAQTTDTPLTLDASGMAKYCTVGGLPAPVYTSAQQADMDAFAAPFNNLIYGQRITCAIPVSCTVCDVILGFVENRGGPGDTPIAAGGRVFTVSFNGTVSDPIDLAKLAGARNPWQKSWKVAGFDGLLRINFQTLIPGMNAIASSARISNAVMPSNPVMIMPIPILPNCLAPIACIYDVSSNRWTFTITTAQ